MASEQVGASLTAGAFQHRASDATEHSRLISFVSAVLLLFPFSIPKSCLPFAIFFYVFFLLTLSLIAFSSHVLVLFALLYVILVPAFSFFSLSYINLSSDRRLLCGQDCDDEC